MDTLHVHAHRLLHQAVFLEAVRIDQRADQRALGVTVESALLLVEGRGRGGGGRQGDRAVAGDAVGARVRFPRLGRAFVALRRPLLLPGREWLEQLPVDEEVAEYAAWTPWHTVGPPLDARGILLVNEDASTPDQLTSLSVVRSSRDVVQCAGEAGLEQQESVVGGSDVAVEGWLQRPARAGTHVGRQLDRCLSW